MVQPPTRSSRSWTFAGGAVGCGSGPATAAMAGTSIPLGVSTAGAVRVSQKAQTGEVSVVGNSKDGETSHLKEGQTDVAANTQDNKLIKQQTVVGEGSEEKTGEQQTGETCKVQVGDMGERQTGEQQTGEVCEVQIGVVDERQTGEVYEVQAGVTEGVIEQGFPVLPKKTQKQQTK